MDQLVEEPEYYDTFIAVADDQVALRPEFFSQPRACLRTSPLGKEFGWGIHFDKEGPGGFAPVESEGSARLMHSGRCPDSP